MEIRRIDGFVLSWFAWCDLVAGFVLKEGLVCWTTDMLAGRSESKPCDRDNGSGTSLAFGDSFTPQLTPANEPASIHAYNGGCSKSKHPMALHLQTNAAQPTKRLTVSSTRKHDNTTTTPTNNNAHNSQASNVHHTNPPFSLV